MGLSALNHVTLLFKDRGEIMDSSRFCIKNNIYNKNL